MTRRELEQAGFVGFRRFSQLRTSRCEEVPHFPGAYVVLRDAPEPPDFLDQSVGEWYRGNDPTVPVAVLQAKWVENAEVIYIGQTRDLRGRLRTRLRFGHREPVRAWGGRYLWQLRDAEELVVAWTMAPAGITPVDLEIGLLAEFEETYGRLPFANLARGRRSSL